MTDKSAIMKKLDAHHLLLDGSAAPGAAWCFRSLQELFASGALQNGTPETPMTVYLAPDVYCCMIRRIGKSSGGQREISCLISRK